MADRIIHLHWNAKDITGQRFGRLVAQYPVRLKRQRVHWFCACDCGSTVNVYLAKLTSLRTQSCGCLQRELVATRKTTHGMTESAEYKVWCGILRRCENPHEEMYENYGGRGIAVCAEWQSFESFYDDMGPRPSTKHSVDRIDNALGYCKENCRWATSIEQARNTRKNHFIAFEGQYKCISEWVEITGMSCIQDRCNRGWSHERIFSQPIRVTTQTRQYRFRTPADAVHASASHQ